MENRERFRQGGLCFPMIMLLAGIFFSKDAAVTGVISKPASNGDKISPWVLERTGNGQETEYLVVLADQADLSAAGTIPGRAEKARYVYKTLLHKAQSTQEPILKWLREHHIEHRSFYIVNMIRVKGDRTIAIELASRADVARIEGNAAIANRLPSPIGIESLLFSSPAGIESNIAYVRAPEVWARGFTGQRIVVGGQDTGYQWDHPALKSQYRGWDGQSVNHDYNWHDSVHSGGGSCGPNSPAPCDDHGHGTHTMGTAVGSDGGANQIGMAPGARWIGCRNMDQGVGSVATYAECFEFFLAPYPVGGNPNQGDPTKAPHVTINSWSCPPSEGCAAATLLQAVKAQRAAGIMTVAAVGNSGPSCSTAADPPGIYSQVFSVGALTNGTDTIASTSSRGPVTIDGSGRRKPDITAPGTNIRSSTSGNRYQEMSGTSMATPHVAGSIALLWSARPALMNNIDVTEQLLGNSALHISSEACDGNGWPNNTYGYGRLDVKSAVDRALNRAKADFLGTWQSQGTFYRHSESATWIYITSAATMITAADFDGDGIDDLAGQWADGSVWVQFSATGQWAKLSSSAEWLTAGDLNGDGKADLIGVWDSVIWTRDSATATWTSISAGASQVAAGDFDGDGKADIIGLWPGNGVWVRYSATGQWEKLAAGGDRIAAGDLDGDGKADLLGLWGSGIWVRYTATGTWQSVSNGANQLAAGDLDGDGKADLIGVWPGSGAWVKYSATGKWEWLSSEPDWIAAGKMH